MARAGEGSAASAAGLARAHVQCVCKYGLDAGRAQLSGAFFIDIDSFSEQVFGQDR